MENTEIKHETSEAEANQAILDVNIWAVREVLKSAFPVAYNTYTRGRSRSMAEFDKLASGYLHQCESLLRQYPMLEAEIQPRIKKHPREMIEYFVMQLPKGGEQIAFTELLRQLPTKEQTVPPPQTQTAEIVTDGNGNVIGVVVNGRFQWLCSKNEIMRIVRSLHGELGIAVNSHKTLATLSANLAPDVAQGKVFVTALTQASKDVSNPKKPELVQGEVNIKEAASKVLPYLKRYLK